MINHDYVECRIDVDNIPRCSIKIAHLLVFWLRFPVNVGKYSTDEAS